MLAFSMVLTMIAVLTGISMSFLSLLRKNSFNRLIFAHININSERNKFELLVHEINVNRC